MGCLFIVCPFSVIAGWKSPGDGILSTVAASITHLCLCQALAQTPLADDLTRARHHECMEPNELIRMLLNLIRKGRVIDIDHDRAMVRVQTGELTSNWLRWMAPAAGTTSEWAPPSKNEQVLILSPGGDLADGVVLRGLYADDTAPPTHDPDKHTRRYPDGAVVEYDAATQTLTAKLPAGASIRLTASAIVQIHTAVVDVHGDVRASGNLAAGTGACGSFITPTGSVVTVMDGIIINIS